MFEQPGVWGVFACATVDYLPGLPKRKRGREGESTEAEMAMAKVAKPKLKPTKDQI